MKWIMCKDKMPPQMKDVILCARSGESNPIDSGELYTSIDRVKECIGDERPMFVCERFYDSTPIAWMAIPEFPYEHEL